MLVFLGPWFCVLHSNAMSQSHQRSRTAVLYFALTEWGGDPGNVHISVNESMNNRSTRRVKHTTALVKSTDRKLQNQQACYDGIQTWTYWHNQQWKTAGTCKLTLIFGLNWMRKPFHTQAVRTHDISGVGNVIVVYIVQHMYLRTLVTVTHTSTACFIDEKSLISLSSQVKSQMRVETGSLVWI